jgi:hypothetical protein
MIILYNILTPSLFNMLNYKLHFHTKNLYSYTKAKVGISNEVTGKFSHIIL